MTRSISNTANHPLRQTGAPILCLGMILAAAACRSAEPQPAIKSQAQEFPLSALKLLDSPFARARDVDKAYILSLDPDRLLSGFRAEAGLPPKAQPYGGWEAIEPGNRFTMAGHTLGHYISALCDMAQSTGDPECRRRIDYIVDELAACQKAGTNGMLAAFPHCRELFAEISAGDIRPTDLNHLNGGYVPLYSIHKVMAGLRDAWLDFGNQTARDVLIRQMDWLAAVIAPLTDEQVQTLLKTEHGGIMESATDVYVITGDPKYLALARRLIHHEFFDPLARGEDQLTGVHGNASIPKAFGAERLYELTGDPDAGKVARFFWGTVVNYRSFVIGGHGCNEYFFATNAFETVGLRRSGPETCNSYNMLKLSRALWLVEPSARTADFIERTLYNHILPSQDPDGGGFAYFTPMRPGAVRTYDRTTFTCCDATGMENHGRYGGFIYSHAPEKLWIDLLIPSELNWADEGATVRLETRFPADGKARITFALKESRKFAVSIRNPGWLARGAMKVAVNGVAETVTGPPDSYATIERAWKSGDRIDVEWPLAIRTEWLPGSTNWISVLRGPVVLAGELSGLDSGDQRAGRRRAAGIPTANVPVFVGSPDDVVGKIKPIGEDFQKFRSTGLAQPTEVMLAPFYEVHHQPYAVYWRLMNRTEYDQGGQH